MGQDSLELMRLFVRTFNAAVRALPDLPLVRRPAWLLSARCVLSCAPGRAQGYTERAAAEAAALPSLEAQRLADEVQRALAEKEEAKKRAEAGRR